MKKACRSCQYCGDCFQRNKGEAWRDWSKRRFCKQEHYWAWMNGENNHMYKNGTKTRPDGYVRDSRTDQYIHRKVMEEYLGRELTSEEHIHHINGNPGDNRIENLELTTNSAHRKEHVKTQLRDSYGRFKMEKQTG